MDEDDSSIPETRKLGIRASCPSAPESPVGTLFSVRSESGSQTENGTVYNYLCDESRRLALSAKIQSVVENLKKQVIESD